jgi:hypothetical protein
MTTDTVHPCTHADAAMWVWAYGCVAGCDKVRVRTHRVVACPREGCSEWPDKIGTWGVGRDGGWWPWLGCEPSEMRDQLEVRKRRFCACVIGMREGGKTTHQGRFTWPKVVQEPRKTCVAVDKIDVFVGLF